MNIHSQTIYMLIYSQIVKMLIAKCILSTAPKKDRLLPCQIWEAHDIKEQEWPCGMMFFSVKLVLIKFIWINQINTVNDIQVQACYRKGSKKGN